MAEVVLAATAVPLLGFLSCWATLNFSPVLSFGERSAIFEPGVNCCHTNDVGGANDARLADCVHGLGLLALVCALGWAPTQVRAEDAIYQQEPYDTIKLDDANKHATLKVRPLDLPDRRLPTKPSPDDELEVRLFDRPRKVYSLAWGHIVEVKLFERMVLDEAERLTEAKKFDDAYPIYEFLEHRYPTMQELPASYHAYLKAGAGEAFKQQRYDEALALLWDLYACNPDYKGVDKAIVAVAGKLIDKRFSDGDFAGARGLLGQTTEKLKAKAEALAGAWNDKLSAKATELLAKVQSELKAGRLAEANRACRQALAAWSEVQGGRELAATIRLKNPVVEIGVTALPSFDSTQKSDSWAARRVQRLLTRSIAEPTASPRAEIPIAGRSANFIAPAIGSHWRSIPRSTGPRASNRLRASKWPAVYPHPANARRLTMRCGRILWLGLASRACIKSKWT